MSNPLEEASRNAVAEYERLSDAGVLKRVLLLDYRCTEGCLLLHVWQNPSNGRMFYRPRYQLSRSRSEAETVEAARLSRTEDGDRKWPARGGNLDRELRFYGHKPDAIWLEVNCRHQRRVLSSADVEELLTGARPGHAKRHYVSPDAIA